MIFRWVLYFAERACVRPAARGVVGRRTTLIKRARSASQARVRVRRPCAAEFSTFAARAVPPTVRASGAACFRWACLPLPRPELRQRPHTGVRRPGGRPRAASLHVALLATRPPRTRLLSGAHATPAQA